MELQKGPSSSKSEITSVSTDDTTQNETQLEKERREGLLENVLRNELIAEEIVAYLALGDMKAASEVSKIFCQMVRATKRFSEKAKLLICEEALKEKGKDSTILKSTFPWKSLKIDLDVSSIPLGPTNNKIRSILEIVDTIQLRITDFNSRSRRSVGMTLNSRFEGILSNSPRLKHLDMESELFEKLVRQNGFTKAKVKEALHRLSSLEISKGNGVSHPYDQLGRKTFSLFDLSFIPGMQLESFKIFSTRCEERVFRWGYEDVREFITRIVSSNAETLKELSLNLNIWNWNFDSFSSLICPHLKSLSIKANNSVMNASTCATLTAFLKNQPLLEELAIDLEQGFPLEFLSTIEGKKEEFKKLHLKSHFFKDGSPYHHHDQVNVNWNFLSGMKKLEDFSLEYKPCHDFIQQMEEFGTGATFLSILPPETLKKIEFNGLQYFWQRRTDTEPVQIQGPERFEILNRWTHLTELRLHNMFECNVVVNDEIMQHIINEFKQLNVLAISGAEGLTDFGITGVPAGEFIQTGVSMKQLTSLVNLKIKNCRTVTSHGIIQAVALPYLRSFEYGTKGTMRVSQAFLMQIAEQNPSLECFSFNLSSYEEMVDVKRALMPLNRRLKKVTNLSERRNFGLGFWGDDVASDFQFSSDSEEDMYSD